MKISRLILAIAASVPMLAHAGFTSTADGKPLNIPDALFDTPAAKEFLKTGKNPYVGNIDAIKAGKRTFNLYSCTQCHGPEAKGQVGPGLTGPNFRYPKNADDHGIFETIWGGTAGGMGAKGVGLMQPDDPSQGLSPDEILKIVAFLRAGGKVPDAAAAPAKATETAPTATPAAASATTDTAPAATAPAAAPTKSKAKKSSKKKKSA